MKVHAQIVVTINPDNDVSATIRIHDGDAPTFDEGKPICDNTVSSHFRSAPYPHFVKGPNSFEVAAVAATAEYFAAVVALNPEPANEFETRRGDIQ